MRYLSLVVLASLIPLGSVESQRLGNGGRSNRARGPISQAIRSISTSVRRTLHRRFERNLPRTVHHRPRRHALCGYWKLVERRVLVPATFEWRRDSCGRYYRVCVRHSYYKTVQTRVWVNSVRHHSRR